MSIDTGLEGRHENKAMTALHKSLNVEMYKNKTIQRFLVD
jgi:hypothetical protein